MQKIYLLAAALSVLSALPSASPAQAVQHDFFNQIETVFPATSDGAGLLLSGVESVSGLPGLGVQRVWPDGQSDYHPLLSRGIPLGLDILPTADSGYLVAASFFQCDIRLNWMLARFDAAGNLLWEKELGVESDPEDAMKLLPGPGATFWLFRHGLVPLHYTADGDLFESGPFPLPVFRGFRKTTDQRLLAYGDAGLALYAPNLLSYQFALQNTPLFAAAVLPGGRFAALSADSLYLLDMELNILKSAAHGLPAGAAREMAYAGGSLHLLANTTPGQLIRFDTAALQAQQAVVIPADAPFQPRFVLATSSDQLLLAGEERAFAGRQVVAVRTVPANGAPDFGASADAAAGDLIVPYSPVGKMLGFPSPAYSIRIDSVACWLKNAGPAPLQTVVLNSVLATFGWHCGQEYATYRRTFSGLNLAPGDSLLLNIGPLDWSEPGFWSPQISLCFWTTLPNDSLDADLANNRTCATLDVIVATQEPGPVAEPLVIVPNPAAEAVELQWANAAYAPARIRVFDAAGQLVGSEHASGAPWALRRRGLPAGLYAVLVQDENGKLFAGRLVWR